MDSVKTRIDEIQYSLDGEWNALRSLASTLANLAACESDGTVTLVAPSLRNTYISCRDTAGELRARKSGRDELDKRLAEGQEKVSTLQKERARSASKLRELAVMAGAIAFEQAGRDDASKELEEALKDQLEHSRALYEAAKAKSVAGAIARARLSLYQKRQESVFFSCFETLDEKGLLDLIKGERATSLVASYRSIKSSIGMLDREIESRKHSISASQMVRPDDDRLDANLASAERELTEAAVAYGLFLFDNGGKWIGPDTGDSFLDIVQKMLDTRKRIEDLEHRIELEKEYSAIADFRSMMEFNNSKIRDLRAEISRIEDEIASIEEDNRTLERKIANVEARVK